MRRTLAIVTFALLATMLVACSDSDHGSNMGDAMGDMGHRSGPNRPVVAGAREIPVRADDLTFTPKSIRMRAGVPVTIVLTSKDLEHDFFVKGFGHIVHAGAGATARGGLTIDSPGSYKFWCTVDGHRQGGMVGTVTVTA